MKKELLAFVLMTVFGSTCVLGQDAQEVTSTIDEVTVFLYGAQVNRGGEIQLKKGENLLRIGELTSYVDPSTVQVFGHPDYDILSVNTQTNYSQSGTQQPEYREKLDSVQLVRSTIKMRESMRTVYFEEKTLLQNNRSIKGTDGALLVEDLEEMADFYRQRMREIEFKLLDIAAEISDLQTTLYRLENEMNQLGIQLNRVTSEIVVKVNSKKSGQSSIALAYRVNGASWYPSYDLRTEDIDAPVELRYKAHVTQNTGQDWENVKLTLSTGNPSMGGIAPELYPWYLYVYDMRKRKSRTYKKARLDAYAYGEEVELMDAAVTEGNYDAMQVEVMNNVFLTEFDINIPFSVPSDNQAREVEIQRFVIPAQYEYFAIPKLDRDAFLMANITDFAQYNLLPGESQIYLGGTFVGSSFLDPVVSEDSLALSLGRDQSIPVKRESIEEFCKNQTLGLKKKTTRAYRITVKNTKTVPIQINIEDQVPLSNTSDIEVIVEEISGAVHDEESGKLSWDLELQPGASKELIIRYSVKYPKNKSIGNI